MLEGLLSVTRAVAREVQTSVAQQAPALAQALDLPQRQRLAELVARGLPAFVDGLARATGSGAGRRAEGGDSASADGLITLGPQPAAAEGATASPAGGGRSGDAGRRADDEAFAKKFAALFLDMGGIFPKLAQVLSLRPDLITNETVLLELRRVQEDCKQMPFGEACALAASESSAFQDGRWQLRDWPRHVHAGSVAQVAPFVDAGRARTGAEDANQSPDGVVKLTFPQMKEIMEVDFRLLRSQLHWMEKSGQWTRTLQTARPGLRGSLDALRPRHIAKLKEVWKIMVEMEGEVLQEFDLRHEAECQQRGEIVLEGLLDSESASCAWLEEWREGALGALLRPAGPQVASQAREAWRGAAADGSSAQRPGGGWLSRLARRAYLGRALADELAEGRECVARLQGALSRLRVRVPKVHLPESGPHVLAMEFAGGSSLKQVLDMVARGGEDAQKAGSWFTALLLFVILPLWGKMLLVVGICHADPHPGNFKIEGIPGLLEEESPDPAAAQPGPGERPGLLSRLAWRSAAAAPAQEPQPGPPLSLTVLDWGSCVDLDDALRQTLCRLIVALGDLRRAQREREAQANAVAEDGPSEAEARRRAADCLRALGVGGEDATLAALGMALFDPAMRSHPDLRGQAEELGRSFHAGSGLGKVLRVVAILVGISRELETRLNREVRERLPAEAASRLGALGAPSSQTSDGEPFFELFLVELWRPFAEEGLA